MLPWDTNINKKEYLSLNPRQQGKEISIGRRVQWQREGSAHVTGDRKGFHQALQASFAFIQTHILPPKSLFSWFIQKWLNGQLYPSNVFPITFPFSNNPTHPLRPPWSLRNAWSLKDHTIPFLGSRDAAVSGFSSSFSFSSSLRLPWPAFFSHLWTS